MRIQNKKLENTDVKRVQRNDHEKIQAKEERKRREGRKELLLMKRAKIILRVNLTRNPSVNLLLTEKLIKK